MTIRQLKMTISRAYGDSILASLIEKSELVEKAKEAFAKLNPITSESSFTSVTGGVFGIAIGGVCPLKSVVSRGMRSVVTGEVAGKSAKQKT